MRTILHLGSGMLAMLSPAPSPSASFGGTGQNLAEPGGSGLNTLLTVLDLLVGLAILWTGLTKVELSKLSKSGLSALGLVSLAGALVLQGWLGLWMFIIAAVLGILGHSLYLALKQDSILTYAATQMDVSRDEAKALHDRLCETEAFALLRPIRSAELVSLLAQRARSAHEVESMAIPIAMLWTVHRPPLAVLVEKFDRILRLYGEPASNAMQVADTLTRATRLAAATFEEMLDASIAVIDPDL